jgi:seryl-tRNA synthetase
VIAKKKADVAEKKENLKELQKEIAEKKSELNEPAYQSIKETLLKIVSNLENQLEPAEQEIKKQEAQLQHVLDVLNNMTATEAQTPARVDENKFSEENGYGLAQLLSPGSNQGVALQKVNPEYFDKSPNAAGAQLIIVTTDANLFSRGEDELNYLQKKTLQLFNQLDYHRLKESMNLAFYTH